MNVLLCQLSVTQAEGEIRQCLNAARSQASTKKVDTFLLLTNNDYLYCPIERSL